MTAAAGRRGGSVLSGARPERGHPVARVIATWVITAVTLKILDLVVPGFDLEGWRGAFAAAAVIGLLNGLLWPLMIRLTLPITVLTLGFAALALNGLVIWIASLITESFSIDAVWQGIVVTIGLTVISAFFMALLSIDDDDFYYRNVIRKQARRRGAISSDVPAVIFLEIDGLAHDVLARAIRDGNVPTMARWLRDGSHRLLEWETDWSSQTGASQAGLLHGSNDDIPAFRWWDKELGRAVASSAPKDVMAVEERLSNGRGLLHADGASRANMFSGDAPHSLLTISTVLKKREGRLGQDYYSYFANPYSFVRTLCLIVAEVVAELYEAAEQKRLDIQPRVRRGVLVYPLMRAWMTVVQRDLQISAVIGDIYAGRPVVYTTFSGYDEMAHHAGIERYETLKILRKLDRQFGRLERAAADAPRPIEFVVLSDHGQTQGATFRDRYGLTLEELVTQACGTRDVEAAGQGDEGWMYVGATVTEASQGSGVLAKGLRAATRERTVDDAVVLGPEREIEQAAKARKGPPEVVVLASGNLGLISFPREQARLMLERLDELYPRLVPTLRAHPGVGFVLVQSAERGTVALGAQGAHYLDEGRVEGADPLIPYGPNAPAKVRRSATFEHCADIMVNSTYWQDLDEVAAFEELVGSHGGLGGEQAFPFLLVPSSWDAPVDSLLGAGAVHAWLRARLAEIGHTAFADGPDAAGSPVSPKPSTTRAR